MSQVYHTAQSPQDYYKRKTFPPARPGHKYCYNCEQEKPLSDYRPWNRGEFGVRPRCADCERAYERARNQSYRREPEHNPRNKFKNRSTPEGYKFCPACEQEKPLDEFFERNGKRVGACKECTRERDRARNKERRPRKTPIIPKATQEGHKFCNTCLREKPHAEFSPDSAQKDGYAGRCKKCKRDTYHAIPEEERERIRALDRAARILHLEKRRARDRKRHNTDSHRAHRRQRIAARKASDPAFRERTQQLLRDWHVNNPLLVREHRHRTKARRRAVKTERISYKRILERNGMTCYICEKPILRANLQFDHVVPLCPRKGEPQGTHTEDNIKPVHDVCNYRKKNKPFHLLTEYDRRGVD